eukprot:6610282-Prymnesium_polylepis.1
MRALGIEDRAQHVVGGAHDEGVRHVHEEGGGIGEPKSPRPLTPQDVARAVDDRVGVEAELQPLLAH